MKRLTAPLAVLVLLAAALLTATTGPATAATPYAVTTLHFKVNTGADGATPCDIIGDLYVPSTASSTTKAPAILTTNGFGGSKDDLAGIGRVYAGHGYVVLAYSGLGFGGSTCKITLDDPDTDGRAASQLVGYLGGASGVAFTDADHTVAAPPLAVVKRDPKNHVGVAQPNDPRVGMVGGSYGGGAQFAAASVDARIDTIIPMITWNDLAYSLGPNNTDQLPGQVSGVTTRTPGAIKINWGLGFSVAGMKSGLDNLTGDPSRAIGCPNFAFFVCPALVTAGSTGFFQPDDVAALQHASVTSFVSKIKIPVFLLQGENDTLFNLNEATATYKALKAQGTKVQMIWHSWGHSGPAAPGDFTYDDPDPATQYEAARVADWFDHYLKGTGVSTGPEFAYFRPWVAYTGKATPAYATSATFPVGSARTYRLSGAGDLVTGTALPGSQNFVTPVAGAPTSIDPGEALGGFIAGFGTLAETDLPLTSATWQTGALGTALRVAGSPVFTVQVSAPTAALTQASGPAGQLVLFAKIVDIAPDGSRSLIKGQIAPVRIPDVNVPVKITMPGIVHQFEAGHRLGIVLAGGSVNYRGNLVAVPVTVASGSTQTLVLPAVN